MVQVSPETVLAALEKSQRPMKIQEIAGALSHHTNAPWEVIFAVEELERAGRVSLEKGRKGRPWRVRLVEPVAPSRPAPP